MTDPHPPPLFHLPPQEVFPGVWMVSSKIWMGIPLKLKISFSRNMVAVLEPDGWVLLNPIRLDKASEAMLLEKGPFRHIVRVGGMHGRDDAYYVDTFGATLWGVPGRTDYDAPKLDREIREGGEFPIRNAEVVVYQNATYGECVVCLGQHKLLVTCDSVQHYDNDRLISPLGRLVMRPMGFFKPCLIGPLWLKMVTPKGGSLKPDFERVMQLDFDHLISGHGTPKIGGARQALAVHVAKLR